ncbi:MAG: hypothetical protein ACLFN9_03550 [Desulfococcaceae bacterium]
MGLGWTLLLALLIAMITAPSLAGEIGFAETFAIAEDRAAVLEQLSPGAEDYYFFHCLHAQHTGDAAAFEATMDRWIERHGDSERARRLRNRQALLAYPDSPAKSLDHIRRLEGLRFNHAPPGETRDGAPLPPTLDPSEIDPQRLLAKALSGPRPAEAMETAGLSLLPPDRLDGDGRRRLLERMAHPDHPELVALVRAELESGLPWSRLPGRDMLLLSHLDRLRRAVPGLAEDRSFVGDYLRRLAPAADVSPEEDAGVRRDWLARCWEFLAPLPEVHAAVQAHVLSQLLELDRQEGRHDRDRFLAYLRIPRPADYLRSEIRRRTPEGSRPDVTGLPAGDRPVSDEALVRDYLFHFLETAETTAPFDQYLQSDWLRNLFAEVKLTRGVGDPERWISMLPPERYAALKDQVVLEFAPDRPRRLAADAPVVLPAEIKNVDALVVRIYALDAFNFYRERQREISPAIELDGISPTWERVHRYPDPPLRRARRRLEFPELSDPGTYVIDLIGGGLRSRAVIRKGDLFAVERSGPAGLEFQVFDETRRRRTDAILWLDGREYAPDENGLILVPFSTAPGPRRAILRTDDRSALHSFHHPAEEYRLSAGFHIERETLLRGLRSQAVLRPRLTLNGEPASLSLLESPVLTLTLRDADGVDARETVEDIELAEDRETAHPFTVPEGLRQATLELSARVRVPGAGETVPLKDQRVFSLNGIDGTDKIGDLFLRRSADGYVVEALGKNGEARPGIVVYVRLKHRWFRETVVQTLRTDEGGQALLGPLPGIVWVESETEAGPARRWPISEAEPLGSRAVPDILHGRVGAPVRLPWNGDTDGTPPPARLLEVRNQVFFADHTETIRFEPGFLVIDPPAGGDYLLFPRGTDAQIRLRIAGGEARDGWLFGAGRMLEAPALEPLGIGSVHAGPDQVVANIGGAGPFTRIHMLATRFAPAYDAAANLGHESPPAGGHHRLSTPASIYDAGRTVGDAYRYILERRHADPHPGNMLDRPELLLHPWAVRDTGYSDMPTEEPLPSPAAEAEASMDRAYQRSVAGARRAQIAQEPSPIGANYDFLAETAAVLLNLRPDENGRVTVDRRLLGAHSHLQIVAADPLQLTVREIGLPSTDMVQRDLRLGASLPADRRITRRNRATPVKAGDTFALPDLSTARYAIYDSVESAFRLLRTLADDPELDAFAFLGNWAELPAEEQELRYGEQACHELNLFLFFKDPEFFHRVIAPLLRQKPAPDFMDLWLLDADLSAFLDPAAFERLTLTEKILLLRKQPDGRARIARYVEDRLSLEPPDPATRDRLFAAALRTPGAEPTAPMPPPASGPAMEMALGLDDDMAETMAVPPEPKPEAEARAFFQPRKAQRAAQRRLYQAPPTTKEWAESRFWKVPPGESTADRVSLNPFWRDFAAHDPDAPFLSPEFIFAHHTRTEVLFALAVLDLPLRAGDAETKVDGAQLTLTPAGHRIVFHRELQPAPKGDADLPVMVRQNFFRKDDRYRYEDGLRLDKFVQGPLEARAAYGGQVVVGNPTSAPLRLDLLLQIPEGAVPLENGFYTHSFPLALDPFETARMDYAFYFPEPGKFQGFPAHVSREETLLAAAEPGKFQVVSRAEAPERDDWPAIARRGDDEAILEALRERNLARISLSDIAFRMKDADFFRAALEVLRERLAYDPVLWSYGVHHEDVPAIREFLSRSGNLATKYGPTLDSPLLTIDPFRREVYAHLEYRPLVNARAHVRGRPTIDNPEIFDQYQRFLNVMIHTPRPGGEKLLEAVYYLLLQDRVKEAAEVFGRIDPSEPRTRMQYDYAQIYLDFSQRNLERARTIATKYADLPVPRWRDRFRNVLAQLDEIAGEPRETVDPEDRSQTQEALVESAPSLNLRLSDDAILLTHRNLESCELRFYPVDVELLFSRNPFPTDRRAQVPPVRPRKVVAVTLDDSGQTRAAIPESLRSANLIVEAAAAGLSRAETRYANDLDVTVIESYGHLRVVARKDGTPIPAAYVKAYARVAGEGVQFYKDGYTDLRGKFDYLSLGSDLVDRVRRLAILVLTEEHGAAIREAAPPGR